jgi:hypothetical protein
MKKGMKNPVMANNSFVKSVQNNMKSMMGDRPGAPEKMKKLDAYMSNDGESAERFSVKLTSGLDKKAFPVK